MRTLVIALALVCISLDAFTQQEVSIIAAKDNTIFSESGTISNGAGIYLFAGKTAGGATRRGLIMFNLNGLVPKGATILSAKVRLNMSKSNASAINVMLHKLTANWGEGTSDATLEEGKGVAATTNDATWTKRFFDTVNWTTAGGDFAATASATQSIGGIAQYEFASTTQLVADVQEWINDSTKNNGWVIIGDESASGTAKRFDSRENSTAGNRPTLVVQYSIVNKVDNSHSQPVQFALEQNYPNPFNPSTTIGYSIPSTGHVSLKVFDLLGKEVAKLADGVKDAGSYTHEWNASKLSSGVYFYRLQAGNNISVKKLMLAK